MSFEEKNVAEDAAARDELVQLGSRTTATVVVDGRVFAGFGRNRQEIREAVARRDAVH